ncbi:MAG: hypothetical protein ACPL7D_06025 [Candidatus Sumerlaeaceae bacterium]
MTPEALLRRLEEFTGLRLHLRLNRNTSQLISVRHSHGDQSVHVSVHRAFLAADVNVIRALAQFVKKPSSASRKILREFIDAIPHTHLAKHARRPRLCARGRFYDLDQIKRELVEQYFDGQLDVAITWGRNGKPSRRRRRHLQLGCYQHVQRLIRIHPVLDSPDVPEYFVRFVVYHELLHAKLDVQRDNAGRRRLHTPQFRALEKRFPHYREAMAFEREFLKTL